MSDDRPVTGGDVRPRLTYISWAESCSRSDATARELGGSSHMVYASEYGSRASTILWKYRAQWRETARILAEEQPTVVAVMTPPLVASLAVLGYARRRGARLVLDAHSAAFLHPRWKQLQWLQRWLCRQAVTTLVHNDHIATLVRAAGGHATLVPDVPVVFEHVERFPRTEAFTVAVVCSFNYDEPVAAIVDAARRTPDVRYFVTGNPKHLAPEVKTALPANVTLTGFLSVPAYGGLLTDADVVMTLTTRDHTMLRGAYEAVYQGTPVIVSAFDLLRREFPSGALHVGADAESIAAGVGAARAALPALKDGASRLREAKLARWRTTCRDIESRLAGDAAAGA